MPVNFYAPPPSEGCFMMDTAVIKFYVSAAVYFYCDLEQMSGEFGGLSVGEIIPKF